MRGVSGTWTPFDYGTRVYFLPYLLLHAAAVVRDTDHIRRDKTLPLRLIKWTHSRVGLLKEILEMRQEKMTVRKLMPFHLPDDFGGPLIYAFALLPFTF